MRRSSRAKGSKHYIKLSPAVHKTDTNQEQSDKILKQFEDAQKEREALREKMENMTLKEIRQYMQDNRGTAQNPISQLVADGTITEDQAKAIRDILPHRKTKKT